MVADMRWLLVRAWSLGKLKKKIKACLGVYPVMEWRIWNETRDSVLYVLKFRISF
jgi:hypothetical protein